jgi:hypothetical protein
MDSQAAVLQKPGLCARGNSTRNQEIPRRFKEHVIAGARPAPRPETTLESERQSAADAALILRKHQDRAVAEYIRPVALGQQIAEIEKRLEAA